MVLSTVFNSYKIVDRTKKYHFTFMFTKLKSKPLTFLKWFLKYMKVSMSEFISIDLNLKNLHKHG